MAFHKKRFPQILLFVFMCSPLHKIASSLYYKRLMVRGVNAYLNLRGNEIGSLAYDGVHIFPLPVCVHVHFEQPKPEAYEKRCPCPIFLHYLANLRRILLGFNTEIVKRHFLQILSLMSATCRDEYGWHILKELRKESPMEEGKVKIVAVCALCSFPWIQAFICGFHKSFRINTTLTCEGAGKTK